MTKPNLELVENGPGPEVMVGDIVKLIFLTDLKELRLQGMPNPPRAERMWVRVTKELSKGKLVGKLDSCPHVISLRLGEEIRFERKHVLHIWRDEKKEVN